MLLYLFILIHDISVLCLFQQMNNKWNIFSNYLFLSASNQVLSRVYWNVVASAHRKVFSETSIFLCLRMTNYSWRVSWFWPQLNLCAWTRPSLSPAQPTACSTTNRKWTLAPWNGTECTHKLTRVGVKSLWILSNQEKIATSRMSCFEWAFSFIGNRRRSFVVVKRNSALILQQI